jgi:uncharacterized protein YbjT (DUF2867 family)
LVGIARGESAQKLRTLGASHVVADYRNMDAFLAALETAVAPGHVR